MRLVRQLAEYTISLKELEDNLLARLAASQASRAPGLGAHMPLAGCHLPAALCGWAPFLLSALRLRPTVPAVNLASDPPWMLHLRGTSWRISLSLVRRLQAAAALAGAGCEPAHQRHRSHTLCMVLAPELLL